MPSMTFEHGVALWNIIIELLDVLIWPTAGLLIIFLFRPNIGRLIDNAKYAELPWGGGRVSFSREAAELNAEANLPDPDRQRPPEAPKIDYNALQLQRGLKPTTGGLDLNYFRELVLRDPNLALAALRMELEAIATNLALGSNVPLDQRASLGRNLAKLLQSEVITSTQYETARKILDLCNRALHGQAVDASSATAVIEAAQPLIDHYKSWLSWNFPADNAGKK